MIALAISGGTRVEKIHTGEFNSSLERSFIVWLDEAFFEKNRGATDSLKSLVTEPVIHINEKHQPARQINSFHRFFGASNSDFYKATDRDDRRDFVLRVSDSRKGDSKRSIVGSRCRAA